MDKDNGDCTRACISSILELNIDIVPNFITLGPDHFQKLWDYLRDNGYEYYGCGWPKCKDRPNGHVLSKSISVDGYVIATVPSKTYDSVTHSVVIDLDGIVCHDPNPNNAWLGINVLESGDLDHWMMIGVKGIEDS